jgi:hypothetical protein
MSGLATTRRVRAYVLLRVDSRCGDGNGVLCCSTTCQCCRRQGDKCVCVGKQNKTEQEAAGEAKEENPELLPRSLPDLTYSTAKACSSLTHLWI